MVVQPEGGRGGGDRPDRSTLGLRDLIGAQAQWRGREAGWVYLITKREQAGCQ